MIDAPIIAFGHQSRVGKNTAAEGVRLGVAMAFGRSVLLDSFARLLKDQAHALWGYLGLMPGGFYEKPENEHLRDVPLPVVGKSPVQLWIEYGQVVRGIHAPTWADACLAQRAPGGLLVISDLRFDNEGDRVQGLGGFCVKVVRAGCPVKGSDRMIREDFPWDALIVNDGDVDMLRRKAYLAARTYLTERCGWGLNAG